MKHLIDIVYIVLAIIIVAISAKRGFIKSTEKLGKPVGSAILCYVFAPKVSAWVYGKFVFDKISTWVFEKLDMALDSTMGTVNVDGIFESLPGIVKKFIDKETISDKLGSTMGSAEESIRSFSQLAAEPISRLISNLVAYAAVFAASFIVLFIVFKILQGLFELPGLNMINRILGIVIGLLSAFIILGALTLVLSLVIGIIGDANKLSELAASSYVFKWMLNIDIFNILN